MEESTEEADWCSILDDNYVFFHRLIGVMLWVIKLTRQNENT